MKRQSLVGNGQNQTSRKRVGVRNVRVDRIKVNRWLSWRSGNRRGLGLAATGESPHLRGLLELFDFSLALAGENVEGGFFVRHGGNREVLERMMEYNRNNC